MALAPHRSVSPSSCVSCSQGGLRVKMVAKRQCWAQPGIDDEGEGKRCRKEEEDSVVEKD